MTVLPPPPVPPRRYRVPAALLLVVLAGAFAWGLAMFALGRGSVERDEAPVQARECAQAALNRVDQALVAGDAEAAARLLGALQLPDGAVWVQAQLRLAKRLDELLREDNWKFIQLSPHARRGNDWLALGHDRQGCALLRSTEAGKNWAVVKRLAKAEAKNASILRCGNDAERSVVVAASVERVGWWSVDGGAHWSEVAWPAKPAGAAELTRVGFAGDGRLVVAVPKGKEHEIFSLAQDGTAIPTTSGVSVLAVVSLAVEALVIAESGDGKRTVRLSVDSGRTFGEAPPELQALVGQTIQTVSVTEQIRLTFSAGKHARFALADGAFLGLGD